MPIGVHATNAKNITPFKPKKFHPKLFEFLDFQRQNFQKNQKLLPSHGNEFQIQLCKELEELYVKDMKQISEIAGKIRHNLWLIVNDSEINKLYES